MTATNPKIHDFPMGKVFISAGALAEVGPDDCIRALKRHSEGDWGDVCEEDRAENDLALSEGFRLLSVYHTTRGTRFWIITEADRSATTILLPEEY